MNRNWNAIMVALLLVLAAAPAAWAQLHVDPGHWERGIDQVILEGYLIGLEHERNFSRISLQVVLDQGDAQQRKTRFFFCYARKQAHRLLKHYRFSDLGNVRIRLLGRHAYLKSGKLVVVVTNVEFID